MSSPAVADAEIRYADPLPAGADDTPYRLALSATEAPDRVTGLSSSQFRCSGHEKSGSKSSPSSVGSVFRRLPRPIFPLAARPWDGKDATTSRSRLVWAEYRPNAETAADYRQPRGTPV